MRSDGYTLAEALAAMLILGLSMGGLVEGARIISRLQTPTLAAKRDSETLRRAEASVASLLALRNGTDQGLTGDRRAFRITCAAGECGLALDSKGDRERLTVTRGKVAQTFPLPPAGNISLVYLARDGRYDRWPQPGSPLELEGIMVVGTSAQGELPFVVARSWIEHPKACEFDMIAKGCRTSGP